MPDQPEITLHPLGLEDENLKGPPTAVIHDRNVRIVLRFAPGDRLFEGDVQELRLLPDTDVLEPRVLKSLLPNAELYVAFVRAAIGTLKPDEQKTKQERLDDFHRAATVLRNLAGPGRSHTPDFFRNIAFERAALIAEGEPHPIKALAERHHVRISAASKWVTEARRRGYINEEGNDG